MANPIAPYFSESPPPLDCVDENSSGNNDVFVDSKYYCDHDAEDIQFDQYEEPSIPSTPNPFENEINIQHISLNVENIEPPPLDDEIIEPPPLDDERIGPPPLEDEKIEPPLLDDIKKLSSNADDIQFDFNFGSNLSSVQEFCISQDLNMKNENFQDENIKEHINNVEINEENDTDISFHGSDISDKSDIPSLKLTSQCVLAECPTEQNEKKSDDFVDMKEIEESKNIEYKNETLNYMNIIESKSFDDSKSIEKSINSDVETEINVQTVNSITHIEESQHDPNRHKNNYDGINEMINEIMLPNLEMKEDSICSEIPTLEQNLIKKTTNVQLNNENDCNNYFEADFSQFQSVKVEENHENIAKEPFLEYPCDKISQKENEDEFTDFKGFTSQNKFHNDDIEEDDEFSDFKEAAPPPPRQTTIQSLNTVKSSMQQCDMKKNMELFLLSFPLVDLDENCSLASNKINESEKTDISILETLNCIDSAKALEFKWTKSNVKDALVKSLGIDSRNILHGEKWNSKVPKFALNLGFNPLEPLKPVKLDQRATKTTYSNVEPSTSEGKNKSIPSAEFDWNTSGLINPLEGSKEIVHEPKHETIQSGELEDTDTIKKQSKSDENDSDEIYDREKQIIKSITEDSIIKTNVEFENIEKNTKSVENIQEENSEQLTFVKYPDVETIPSSSFNTVSSNQFVVQLKETHIFTPSKYDTAISRNTTVDFDYEIAAAGTIIDENVIRKEYRDIEYDPNKYGSISQNMINTNRIDMKASPNLQDLITCTKETTNNLSSIPWDSITNNYSKEDAEPIDILRKSNNSLIRKELSISMSDDFGEFKKGESNDLFMKPTIGISPTENVETTQKKSSELDDDFTDFQSVPATMSQQICLKTTTLSENVYSSSTNTLQPSTASSSKNKDNDKKNLANTSDKMILSPAILLPQAIKIETTNSLKIEWPQPGINPEELARIETLFPQTKSSNSISKTNNQNATSDDKTNPSSDNFDDDWSDFVSVPATNNIDQAGKASSSIMKTINLNTIYCPTSPSKVSTKFHNSNAISLNNDDEWSEFVSSTPKLTTTTTDQNISRLFENGQSINYATNLGILKNNCSPQNAVPIIKPNQQNSVNNNLINNNKISQYLLNNTSSNEQQKNVMQLNSLKIMDFVPQHHYHNQHHIGQHQNMNHQNNLPNISLIPDLGFAAPQSLINSQKKKITKK